MKVASSWKEATKVSEDELGVAVYDNTRFRRPLETVKPKPREVLKRVSGERVLGEQWIPEREKAHAACSVDESGHLIFNLTTLTTLLELHPYWRGGIKTNLLTGAQECGNERIDDTFVTDVRKWFERGYWARLKKDETWDAIESVSRKQAYHPVVDYLEVLQWDGVERIKEVPKRLSAKAEHAQLYEAYFRKWFLGAVSRVFEPGSKFDTMLVLCGEQGTRKSSFFKALAGTWFNDSALNIDKTADFSLIHKAWIHEFGELESFTTRADLGRLKAFLTSTEDNYRPAYGRKFVCAPRRCVFVGTTNEDGFLRDKTGNRRFWVVDCEGMLDLAWVNKHRDQLWAEAVDVYRNRKTRNAVLYLELPETEKQRELNEQHEAHDPWSERVENFLIRQIGSPVRINEVLDELKIDTAHQSPKDSQRVGAIMKRLGWLNARETFNGKQIMVWRHKHPSQQAEIPF